MNVPLSENWQRFVRDEVQSGRFPSESAVVEGALALLQRQESTQAPGEPNGSSATIGQFIDQVMADLPDEVLDRLPVDGAEQHDHYIYGTPKRTT